MRITAVLLVLALAGTLVSADEATTARVVRGDLEVFVTANGRFEARQVGVVVPTPEAWRDRYVVVSALEPGTLVRAGEVVMRFSDQRLEDAVDDARFDLKIAERDFGAMLERQRQSVADSEQELARLEAEASAAAARLEGYLGEQKPIAEAQRKLNAESSAFSVENAREELAQLEKMYEEDELVDETEKIVLERARWNLHHRETSDELGRRRRAYAEKYEDPDQEGRLRVDAERKHWVLESARKRRDLTATYHEMERTRGERGLERKRTYLERLSRDLAATVVRAPAAGILLHGSLEGAIGRRHRPGTEVAPYVPVVTVVDPSMLVAVLSLPADEVLRVSAGQRVTVDPAAKGAPDAAGEVSEIAAFPQGGAFEVRCSLGEGLPGALLGHSLSARISIARAEGALLVPLAAVHRDETGVWCLVARDEGRTERVWVKTGLDDGERVVVEEGLAEGEEVILPEGGE